jgi:hypothetical protein
VQEKYNPGRPEGNSQREQNTQAIKRYVDEEFRRHQGTKTREEIIRGKLNYEAADGSVKNERINNERRDFFGFVLLAWDAIAYHRYEIGSQIEQEAGEFLHDVTARLDKPVIPLQPLQTEMLDALAHAAGIPHHEGKNEIPIPEKLFRDNYSKWKTSNEYRTAYNENMARRNNRR